MMNGRGGGNPRSLELHEGVNSDRSRWAIFGTARHIWGQGPWLQLGKRRFVEHSHWRRRAVPHWRPSPMGHNLPGWISCGHGFVGRQRSSWWPSQARDSRELGHSRRHSFGHGGHGRRSMGRAFQHSWCAAAPSSHTESERVMSCMRCFLFEMSRGTHARPHKPIFVLKQDIHSICVLTIMLP